MKCFCITLLIACLICISASAQQRDNPITGYSTFLSQRNAQLIGCDSIAFVLQPVYAHLIMALIHYQKGIRDNVSIKRLQVEYRLTEKRIYKLLAKKQKRNYKRLVKSTGNVFLL